LGPSGPPDEFGGPYQSECAAGGCYGALKPVALKPVMVPEICSSD
jgi:hypothetical protein